MQGVPVTPSGEGAGWLARWLSVGGEGVVSVSVSGFVLISFLVFSERDILLGVGSHEGLAIHARPVLCAHLTNQSVCRPSAVIVYTAC